VNRLLVTGVDTVVGSNLALALSDRWQILGLYSNETVHFDEVSTAPCQQRNFVELRGVVDDYNPRWIIHCPATCASGWDEFRAEPDADPAQTARLLADVASGLDARLTVISTDAVFAGPRMFHEETWPATAASFHAEQARRVEDILAATAALVVRTHAYGWSPVAGRAGFAEKSWEALISAAVVAADGRRYATPILATDLAELLTRAYEHNCQGLYHMSGAERTSPFRFVRELAAAGDLEPPSIPRSLIPEREQPAWEGETSLNSRRARRALEMPTPLLREGLSRFAQQPHNGWRDRLRGTGRTRVLERAA